LDEAAVHGLVLGIIGFRNPDLEFLVSGDLWRINHSEQGFHPLFVQTDDEESVT
jgi:hypothetical protein